MSCFVRFMLWALNFFLLWGSFFNFILYGLVAFSLFLAVIRLSWLMFLFTYEFHHSIWCFCLSKLRVRSFFDLIPRHSLSFVLGFPLCLYCLLLLGYSFLLLFEDFKVFFLDKVFDLLFSWIELFIFWIQFLRLQGL